MVRPYDDNLMNMAEATNEVFIVILAYGLCLMSDFVADLEMEFNIGWSVIGLIIINVAFNMIIFLIALFHDTKRSIKRRLAIRAVKNALAAKEKLDKLKKEITGGIEAKLRVD